MNSIQDAEDRFAKYSNGDTVGVGLLLDSFNQRKLFFTKNGQLISKNFFLIRQVNLIMETRFFLEECSQGHGLFPSRVIRARVQDRFFSEFQWPVQVRSEFDS